MLMVAFALAIGVGHADVIVETRSGLEHVPITVFSSDTHVLESVMLDITLLAGDTDVTGGQQRGGGLSGPSRRRQGEGGQGLERSLGDDAPCRRL